LSGVIFNLMEPDSQTLSTETLVNKVTEIILKGVQNV